MADKKLEDVIKAFTLGESIVVTIPKDIREEVGIEDGTYLRIRANDGRVILEVMKEAKK